METRKDTENLRKTGVWNAELLWDILLKYQGHTFYTAKHLEFTYTIRGKGRRSIRSEKTGMFWCKLSLSDFYGNQCDPHPGQERGFI